MISSNVCKNRWPTWLTRSHVFRDPKSLMISSKNNFPPPFSTLLQKRQNVTLQSTVPTLSPSSSTTFLTTSSGTSFTDFPRMPRWDMNLPKFRVSSISPTLKSRTINNCADFRSVWSISPDQLTSSSTKSGQWRTTGRWTRKAWSSYVQHSLFSCVNNWLQPLAGLTPYEWTTYAVPRVSATRRTNWRSWNQPSSKRRLNPSVPSSTRSNHANFKPNHNETRPLATPTGPIPVSTTTILGTTRSTVVRTTTATTTTTAPFFTGTSKTDGGTTTTTIVTDDATARDGAEVPHATDRREESRRETHLLLRRMADCYRQPRHLENRQRRVPDPVHESSADIGVSHSASPSVGGSNEGYRLRSVRFDDQRSNRIREWARLFKSVVRHPEKDWRPTPSTQPAPPQRIPPSTAFQNGNNPTRMFRTKPERLSNINRPERCLSPRPNPPRFETVPPVPLERTTIPVQGSSVRTFTRSPNIHEGSQTPLALGKTKGYSDIGVPRRPDYRSRDKGKISQGYRDGVTQTREFGLLDKSSQVQSNTIPEASTSRLRDRHDDYDAQGSRSEDSRRTTRSLQVGEQGDVHSTSTLLVHRQGHRYDGRCLPSTSEGSTSSSRQDPRAQIGILLGELDHPLSGSNRRTPLVAYKSAAMERALVDHVDPTERRLHGRLGLRMGNSSGQQIVQRIMVTSTPIATHQLQGTDDGLHRPSPSRGERAHGQHNFRQHNDDSIHQPLRRDTITRLDGAGNIVVGVVSQDWNKDPDDIRPFSVQPCRCTITPAHRTIGVVNQRRLLPTDRRSMGTPPGGSLCLTRKPSTPSIHDLEAYGRGNRLRRTSTPLETIGQRILMPSMESHPSCAAENQAGGDHCNNSNPCVANSSVVSNDQDDGNCPTNLDTSPPSVACPRKRPRHTGKEPPLVTLRLESKRRQPITEEGIPLQRHNPQPPSNMGEVVAHDNWSSSALFEKFYHLYTATKTILPHGLCLNSALEPHVWSWPRRIIAVKSRMQ
ncbi:MAG: hypothetical protein J3Q66DRAFT_306321 [Benniella sp.]|nr:MAG: hypothetical protein J3Q66DRAFT_306321 [Benniella sp.]